MFYYIARINLQTFGGMVVLFYVMFPATGLLLLRGAAGLLQAFVQATHTNDECSRNFLVRSARYGAQNSL